MSSNETKEKIIFSIKRTGKWITVIALTVLLMILAYFLFNKIKDEYDNRLKIIESIKGIKLGEKFQDFMFRNEGFSLEADEDKNTEGYTFYKNKDKMLKVRVLDNKIVGVMFACAEKYDYTFINGIDCESSGDNVLEKYNNEIRVQCLKDKKDEDYLKLRVYDSLKFSIRYYLFSNKVVAFSIADTIEFTKPDGFINKKWSACE